VSVLARAAGVLGELVLRRREIDGQDAVELLSNGVLLMDTADASTERELATRALDDVGRDGLHVVVGGLGLGCTAAALLADPRVTRVTVVEIEATLVGWARDGLVPGGMALLDDDRLAVVVGDVAEVLPALALGSVDAVLLDVDNGPGFLVHPRNARVYSPELLGGVAGALRPGGCLVVWSADRSAELAAALSGAVGSCRETLLTVHREGRDLEYALYAACTPVA